MLKFSNVSKIFVQYDGSSIKAIEDISLDIQEKEFVAFVGPSGCGKTTLLKLIAGLEKPTIGKIIFNGREIESTSKERGMIFQHFTLFPWLSVSENIAFGLRLRGYKEAKIQQIVNHYLKLTGLEHFKYNYPNTLSGGMQQRIAIARTLANDPKILLLDEPFGSLDVQTRSQMQEFLSKLWEEEQKTMIMVTHDIEEALYLSNRVFILSIKPGTVKEIIEVTLRHPRRPEIRFQENFLRMKKHISYIIRSESIKAALEIGTVFSKDTLKIGLNIWPGNAPFYLAKDKELFIQNSLDAETISLEKGEDRIKPWKEGNIDVLNVTLDTAVILKQRIPDLKIFAILNRSFGGDALVAHPSIESIRNLKGRKVGLEKNWVGHFFFLYLLNQVGLSSKDVEIVHMKGSDIGSSIIAREIDAGVLWEPWLSKAKEYSGAKILATTKDYPIIYDVLIVKDRLWRERKKELEKLQKVWCQAVDLLSNKKSESLKIISSYLGISEIELAEELDKLQFSKTEPNDLKPLIDEIQSVFLKEKLIKNAIDFNEFVIT